MCGCEVTEGDGWPGIGAVGIGGVAGMGRCIGCRATRWSGGAGPAPGTSIGCACRNASGESVARSPRGRRAYRRRYLGFVLRRIGTLRRKSPTLSARSAFNRCGSSATSAGAVPTSTQSASRGRCTLVWTSRGARRMYGPAAEREGLSGLNGSAVCLRAGAARSTSRGNGAKGERRQSRRCHPAGCDSSWRALRYGSSSETVFLR